MISILSSCELENSCKLPILWVFCANIDDLSNHILKKNEQLHDLQRTPTFLKCPELGRAPVVFVVHVHCIYALNIHTLRNVLYIVILFKST
jgi:hypothetical protein